MSSNYPPPQSDPDEPVGQSPYDQAPPPLGSGYGTMPGMASGSKQPASDVAQPQSIALAVKLMYVGAALSLLSVISTLFMKDEMRQGAADALAKQGKSVDATNLDSAVTVALATAIAVGLLGVALWLWMARANGSGRSWARIIASVLGGLNIVFSLIGFTGNTSTTLSMLVSIVMLVLAIAILVLLWRKESSAFYTAHSGATY